MKFTGSFLLLILAFQLSAQYNRLVTPSDGASVVFSSSLRCV